MTFGKQIAYIIICLMINYTGTFRNFYLHFTIHTDTAARARAVSRSLIIQFVVAASFWRVTTAMRLPSLSCQGKRGGGGVRGEGRRVFGREGVGTLMALFVGR